MQREIYLALSRDVCKKYPRSSLCNILNAVIQFEEEIMQSHSIEEINCYRGGERSRRLHKNCSTFKPQITVAPKPAKAGLQMDLRVSSRQSRESAEICNKARGVI